MLISTPVSYLARQTDAVNRDWWIQHSSMCSTTVVSLVFQACRCLYVFYNCHNCYTPPPPPPTCTLGFKEAVLWRATKEPFFLFWCPLFSLLQQWWHLCFSKVVLVPLHLSLTSKTHIWFGAGCRSHTKTTHFNMCNTGFCQKFNFDERIISKT